MTIQTLKKHIENYVIHNDRKFEKFGLGNNDNVYELKDSIRCSKCKTKMIICLTILIMKDVEKVRSYVGIDMFNYSENNMKYISELMNYDELNLDTELANFLIIGEQKLYCKNCYKYV